ncbi:MAG: hypothetical protein TQ37_10405 [Candidatus Synechococcus spongiarum 15L]|uniref:Uncharacterized protein n=2 Tax=Candidatus Synechococcus spongiarum TaxID=431041 RepID=A0A0G8ARM3_9SYNE|nr:MAG: hypothetical protein TQ37_10405 [Candidatus Synechococcus spongiarum 15L]
MARSTTMLTWGKTTCQSRGYPGITMATALFSNHLSENREELENRLLELLPEDGSPVGNGSAQQQLGCSNENYAAVKATLLVKRLIRIELNRTTNETLEAMAKALFKYWFVDFDPVRAKAEGRSTGLSDEISALFPDSFEDSELGEIPRGVGVLRLVLLPPILGAVCIPARYPRCPTSPSNTCQSQASFCRTGKPADSFICRNPTT